MNHEPGPAAYPEVGAPRRVRELPLRQQPRELVDRLGCEHVTEDVLLAILLRHGTRGLNVVDLARSLLLHYGSLTEMARASVDELASLRGMGRVKAQMIRSALELGRRLSEENRAARQLIKTPPDVCRVLADRARTLDEEHFWVLVLDTKNRMKRPPVEVSMGILDASLVHAREVFREAVRANGAAVVLAHNHPSGDPTPSADDLRLTRALIEAGRIVDIRVLDHVVLGRDGDEGESFASLRELGLVDFQA
jgi:DNA repair protein RadC